MFSAMQVNGLMAIVALWKDVLKVQSTLSPDFKYFMNIESNVKKIIIIYLAQIPGDTLPRFTAKETQSLGRN